MRLGDPGRLRQVLFNLLHNAIKFTPEGGSVKVSIQEHANDQLRVCVKDTGIGTHTHSNISHELPLDDDHRLPQAYPSM